MDKDSVLSFDLIARGWAKFGDEWKLVEIDLTKSVDYENNQLVIMDWYEALRVAMENDLTGRKLIHVLWTKDDHRDKAIFEGTFS